jgi:predicted membrane-bound mannosyltransferase
MIIPIDEFLPLLFASVGAVYYAVKGSLFSRFLIYWATISLIIYSFFGEKMPQTSLNIILPVIALGGMFIGFLLQGEGWSRRVQIVVRSGLAVIVLLLFSFTAYTACKESYQVQDTPPQMLLYAGTSADVPSMAAKIDELAQKTGEGHNLSITIDRKIVNTLEPAYDSGLYWYLRDYTNVDTPDLSSITSVPSGAVLILAADHVPADSQYLEKYGKGEKVKTTIWFPEEYKNGFNMGGWWNYFIHRDTKGPYWNSEVVVYFLKAE